MAPSDDEDELPSEDNESGINQAIPGMETSDDVKKKPIIAKDKAFEKLTENLKTAKDVKKMVRCQNSSNECKSKF